MKRLIGYGSGASRRQDMSAIRHSFGRIVAYAETGQTGVARDCSLLVAKRLPMPWSPTSELTHELF